MSIQYKRVSTDEELEEILSLQKINLSALLPNSEKQKEGFITVSHTFDILKKMNDACPHIIAKAHGKVVGYALTMLPSFRYEIPILTQMFESADKLLGDKNYLAMGQICIDKGYRGKGLFKGMYSFYKSELSSQYDCLFTEVATSNQRSLNAHLSVGFKIMQTQTSDDISWNLVNWDWN